MKTQWQLSFRGRVIKTFPTREQCVIEAVERGWSLTAHPDFPGDPEASTFFHKDVVIKRIDK